MKNLRSSKIIFATIAIFVLLMSASAFEWPWDHNYTLKLKPTPTTTPAPTKTKTPARAASPAQPAPTAPNHIRDFILDHSKTIVQDDAGIPISSFIPQQWNIRVFGNYVGPIEIFKQHYQPKLKDMFDQTAPPPITFNFGYRYNYTQSHVIVATRL